MRVTQQSEGRSAGPRPAGSALAAHLQAEVPNPLARLFFWLAILLLFFRISMLHELMAFHGLNLYSMVVLMPVCLGGLFLTGRARLAFQHSGAKYWIAFTLWMILATPFSTWMGGSMEIVNLWMKGCIGLVFIFAGLIATWKEIRIGLFTIALGGAVNAYMGKMYAVDNGRLGLLFGTMGNANDFAAHLLAVVPFVLFVALGPGKHNWFMRAAALGVAAILSYQMLATGSRGALIGIIVAVGYAFLRATAKQRVVSLAVAPVCALVLVTVLPDATVNRLTSFSSDDESADLGAIQSKTTREYLFRRSIHHTLTHPILGVGPGQFSNFEGNQRIEAGMMGMWHSTHNSLTQISSECGIPGALFYLIACVITYRILNRITREARRLGMVEMSAAAWWTLVSFVGYTGAAMFLNLGYLYYYPMLTGLAIAFESAFKQELALRGPTTVSAVPNRRRFVKHSSNSVKLGRGKNAG
jgi:hypothetical protein